MITFHGVKLIHYWHSASLNRKKVGVVELHGGARRGEGERETGREGFMRRRKIKVKMRHVWK